MSEGAASWRAVVEDWHNRPAARQALAQRLLSGAPEAIYWETSPSLTGDEPFSDVALPSTALAGIRADRNAFAEHLTQPVVSFSNLSGDSRLVAPSSPPGSAHLLAFLRVAQPQQVDQLFACIAAEVLAWWSDSDRGVLWLSTHGTGVPWLHVRLDPRPKYYRSALRRLSL